jgi:hypothetical protein
VKPNPLKLNPLQLRTLTLLQEMAKYPELSTRNEESGEVFISNIPEPHGNHFHVGRRVVMAADATGLGNQAVWVALERKGLAKATFPFAITLTPAGLEYDTGLADVILHGSDH